jgi:hypothetical protein
MPAGARPPGATPRISVVMPSFNQAQYLGEAVRSVLQQPPEGLELVVADGGSSDGSVALLAALEAEFPGRLRWTSGPDDGPAQAVNRAVSQARAPLLGWLNSDDLYTPGAIGRALAAFDSAPGTVMVYGHGEHVDAVGAHLEPYPTRPPSTRLAAWADGCFICQPSAFFRRDTFLALGGLDEGLRAAFDFDFWLRLFKAHPGQVAFVDAVQAQSRLHDASITMRQRERVAMEGLQVVAHHLGAAPPHWLLTHAEELLAAHPFHAQPTDLRERLAALGERARPWLGVAGHAELKRRLAAHRRLQLATAHTDVGVHADGWAGPQLDIRLWQPAPPLRSLRLYGEHPAIGGGPLQLEIERGDGMPLQRLVQRDRGRFSVVVALPEAEPGAQTTLRIRCAGGFVPAEHEPGSMDRRRLCYRIERAVWSA